MSITESDTLPVGKHATLNGVFKPSTIELSINDQFVPAGRRQKSSIGSLYLMGEKYYCFIVCLHFIIETNHGKSSDC